MHIDHLTVIMEIVMNKNCDVTSYNFTSLVWCFIFIGRENAYEWDWWHPNCHTKLCHRQGLKQWLLQMLSCQCSQLRYSFEAATQTPHSFHQLSLWISWSYTIILIIHRSVYIYPGLTLFKVISDNLHQLLSSKCVMTFWFCDTLT